MSGDPQTSLSADQVKAWRKARRAEHIARRAALPEPERRALNARITDHLIAGFEIPEASVVG